VSSSGRSLYRVVAWVLVVCLLVTACATRNVPPIGAGGQPFRPEADERAMWAKAEKEEEALLKKATVYSDPLLEEYLGQVGDRLMPESVRAAGGIGFRFGVISDPTLNAFAMPNGRIYVHTGLLSRLENEAQLATILGHEMVHVTHRHALRFQRDAQRKQIVYSLAAIGLSIGVAAAAGSRVRARDPVGAAVISQTANAVLGLGLQLAAIASITGYGRDLEREADADGMDLLVNAGYDPTQAPRVFELLKGESGDRGALETFFFGTHPRLEERLASTKELVATRYARAAAEPTVTQDTDEFRMRMRAVVRDNAALDVKAGRFELAERQLERVLALTPRDPVANLYYGDLHRLQAQRARTHAERGEQTRKALARYERAAELDPAYPDPFRQLGLLYYQQKEPQRAKAAFERYLALKPDAPDARRIKEYIIELDR
jgi:beta-barrel assembly-enhancing protease